MLLFQKLLLLSFFIFQLPEFSGATTSRCENLFSPQIQYSPLDFPSSRFWIGSPSDLFSLWAAEKSNWVANQSAESLQETLLSLGKSRNKLQYDIDKQTGEYSGALPLLAFGLLRTLDNYLKVYPLENYKKIFKTTNTNFFTEASLKAEEFDLVYIAKLRGQLTQEQDKPELFFYVYDRFGAIILTHFEVKLYGEQGVLIHHPDHWEWESIYSDVLIRLHALTNATSPQPEEFYRVMRNFFIAVPFFRGTAAIGRVFFSGLYRLIFGKKLILPKSVDIKAMLYQEDDFVQMLTRINLPSANQQH